MSASSLVPRQYKPGEWQREKIELHWHYFRLPRMTTPVAFHEDDVTYGTDGVLTLRAEAVQWESLDYLAQGS